MGPKVEFLIHTMISPAHAGSNCPSYGRSEIAQLRDLRARSVSAWLDIAVPTQSRAGAGAGAGAAGLAAQHVDCADVLDTELTRSDAFRALADHARQLFVEIASKPWTGRNASYIAALSKPDPTAFGISIVTADGGQLSIGEAHLAFTIQSTSKPLGLAAAFQANTKEDVQARIASDACVHPFNAPATVAVVQNVPAGSAAAGTLIGLKTPQRTGDMVEQLRQLSGGDAQQDRPANGMINMGALAVTELISQSRNGLPLGVVGQIGNSLDLVKSMGRSAPANGPPLVDIDFEVHASELCDSPSNQTLARANLLLGQAGAQDDELAEQAHRIVDAYTSNCSLRTHAAGLATIYSTIANLGRNPFTGEQILQPSHCNIILDQMDACGLYEASKTFHEQTGLTCKSGVSGVIVAVDRASRLTIAVYSPPLDEQGNSARGMEYLRRLVACPQWHAMRSEALLIRPQPN